MRTKPSGSRCSRKRRKNSSSDRVSSFCSLLWAESRQRKVTLPVSKRDQTMVADGHAMGVAAQIVEHKLWATEGWFQVDNPFFPVQGSEPGGKGFRLSEECEVSVETELAVTEGLLERADKLSAKNLT